MALISEADHEDTNVEPVGSNEAKMLSQTGLNESIIGPGISPVSPKEPI